MHVARPSLKSPLAFPIVGVGASAGGLEAFMEMFRALPPDTGMAFVLIQHLSPQHLSMLSTFVQKVTRMNVRETTDGMKVEPNCVYIIPPNAVIEIFHGILHLSAMSVPHAGTMPVNAFFKSLARDQGNLAIGVILSGTGSDGADGLREIKADGGITFVQDPKSAKFDGMPRAAILASTPDHILSVDNIAKHLITIASHPIVNRITQSDESNPPPETLQVLMKIFILIRSATKIDFSTYKLPTMIRRTRRRMVLHRTDTLEHYLKHLQSNPSEVTALFEDLLINVTDFFRDPEAFDSLQHKILPEIIKNRRPGTPIRVWIPGCSTGEEVYSIAITLLEFLGNASAKYPIQIYGTDICESAIKIARTGTYPESASKNMSAQRLERFFQKVQDGYRITKVVRDCCIFSIQDVTSQPPINRLDLLSCRNLMIYLGAEVQKKLMETFFFALNPDGILMLGSSESVGTASNLFAILDKKNKIYSKKAVLNVLPDFQISGFPPNVVPTAIPDVKRPAKAFNPVLEAEQIVLNKYAPAWVLVNQKLDIVQFRGVTRHYIEPASGQPTWNLLRMLRSELSSAVRIVIHSALKEGISVRKNDLIVPNGNSSRSVDIEAIPLAATSEEPHCLLLFIDRLTGTSLTNPKSLKAPSASQLATDHEITELKNELVLTQKSLQSIIEDQNATTEEMQSANEEVMSANEELQSTNEELETAKEELQSTNEELTTLNEELSNRNNELAQLSNDLVNVLSNVNVSIVMVGSDLRIRRYTPMAEKLLNLIATDVGRSLLDINIGFQIEHLSEKIKEVVNSLSTIELETQNRDGVWHAIRFRPYKTESNKIEGAVITFINIHEMKIKEKAATAAQCYSDGIIQTVRDPLIVLDEKHHVERVNQAFYDIFHVKESETIGRRFNELGNQQWNIPALNSLLNEVLPKKQEVKDFQINHRFESIGKRLIRLNARVLECDGQTKLLILISLQDLTEWENQKATLQL